MLRLFLVASIITLFGCASDQMDGAAAPAAQAAAERDCFNTRNISGFSSVADDTVQIRAGVDDYYEIDVFGSCNQLDWANRLAIVSDSGAFMCTGDISPGRVISDEESCQITNITRVYPEDARQMETLEDEADS